MWRQVQGEALNVASVLTWGPCYYHQKRLFTRISGETDFPCLTDDRVGEGRTYAKLDGPLSYRGFIEAIRAGRSYVSDGRSHLLDFSVNGTGVGTRGGEVPLERAGHVRVSLRAAAWLKAAPDDDLRSRPPTERPYWDLRRARIGEGREVPIEVVVNGRPVARRTVAADAALRTLELDVPIERSSWLAARILPSSHTNPIFVNVGGKPVRAPRRSAQWCLDAVNQCWTQKRARTAAPELKAAEKGYEHARQTYRRLLAESERE